MEVDNEYMSRNHLVLLVASVIIVTASVVILLNNLGDKYTKSEIESIVSHATSLYKEFEARGEILPNGPCLSNDLRPGWVVDLVHNPRSEIDDLEENQCRAYLEGRAKHFVELDLEGNLVRVK